MSDKDYTYGPAYSKKKDGTRIGIQFIVIRDYMIDGKWRTLGDIEKATAYPQASISAQLRHMRKPRFGGYVVEKRRVVEDGGLWEYRVWVVAVASVGVSQVDDEDEPTFAELHDRICEEEYENISDRY